MTKQEMLNLGAPELPEGYYYHVRSSTLGGFYVDIMKTRKYIWDKTMASVLGSRWDVNNNMLFTPVEAIRDTAQVAYKQVFVGRPDRVIWWEEFSKLEGDHK